MNSIHIKYSTAKSNLDEELFENRSEPSEGKKTPPDI